MNWWQYLLLANIYLALFYMFYALLLRRETFFQLNRLYLVSTALLSFMIPVIQADWVKNLFITQQVRYSIYGGGAVIYQFKPIERAPLNLGQLFAVLYLAGVAFLTIRFVWQLIVLNKVIRQPARATAFSFFKKIKIDAAADSQAVISAHEQAHARQWHSADVLVIEAVMIVNWLNPVVYFYRRAIKHIHEFIADSQAIKATDKADYALLLLSQTFNAPQHHLANHFFNHSLLKQRIMMLQKNKSQRIALIKYGLSAPLFVLMMILSSATANGSEAIKGVNKAAQKVFALPADTSIVTKIETIKLLPPAANTSKIETVRILPPATDTSKDVNLAVSATGDTSGMPNAGTVVLAYNSAGGQAKVTGEIKQEVNSATARVVYVTGEKDGSGGGQNMAVADTGNQVFTAVQVIPSFPGGAKDFYRFLAESIKYPAAMRENNIQGRVILTFVVEKDGSITNIKVLRDPGYGAGEEAARVMAMSPKWNPGIQNGKPVRVQFTVPVNFSLNADKDTGNAAGAGRKAVVIFDKGFNGPKPLMVLDGKVIKDNTLKTLNPSDIYSIVVLKDKSATDKYGADGANGVIVITTKKDK